MHDFTAGTVVPVVLYWRVLRICIRKPKKRDDENIRCEIERQGKGRVYRIMHCAQRAEPSNELVFKQVLHMQKVIKDEQAAHLDCLPASR